MKKCGLAQKSIYAEKNKMEQENNDLFDEIGDELTDESQHKEQTTPTETTVKKDVFDTVSEETTDDMEVPPKEIESDFELGELSFKTAEQLEVQIADEDYDEENKETVKTFVIKTAELLKPNTRDNEGKFIPPAPFNKDKPDGDKGYKTYLKITYEECNYLSLIPNVKWYVGVDRVTKKKRLNPWFFTKMTEDKLSDNFTAEISKLYYKYCVKFGYKVSKTFAELGTKLFVEGLVGKKVKLTQWSTDHNGMKYRIDIKEFI